MMFSISLKMAMIEMWRLVMVVVDGVVVGGWKDSSKKEEEAGGEYVVFPRMGVIRQARSKYASRNNGACFDALDLELQNMKWLSEFLRCK